MRCAGLFILSLLLLATYYARQYDFRYGGVKRHHSECEELSAHKTIIAYNTKLDINIVNNKNNYEINILIMDYEKRTSNFTKCGKPHLELQLPCKVKPLL